MLETPEQRTKLLKAGFSGKEIERLYIEQNNIKIVNFPVLHETMNLKGVNMNKPDINNIDDTEEIANILISLGMSRNAAAALSYLRNSNSATSIDLERSARLRQPEVSIAIKQLKEWGWIYECEDKKTGRGRPNKIYSLKVGFNGIIAKFEEQQSKAFDEAKAKIERLKELGNIRW